MRREKCPDYCTVVRAGIELEDPPHSTLSPWVAVCHPYLTGHGGSLAFRVTGYHSPHRCNLVQLGATARAGSSGCSGGGGGGSDVGGGGAVCGGISLGAAGTVPAGVQIVVNLGA